MSTNFCRTGNVVLVILNLSLIPLWVQVLIPFCIHDDVIALTIHGQADKLFTVG
jgi:hypothetical protein